MEPYHKAIKRLTEATTPEESKGELLKDIIAVLRAQRWLYETLHWQVQGSDFYQLHLLFERLYNSVLGEIDGLAEKMVCYYGREAVDAESSLQASQQWLKKWKGEPVARAITSEKQLQILLQQTYKTMKEKKQLSLGLDDFIMGLANNHESNLYLLEQINK
jgi:starvation-inducible DNA-binding protein